MALGSPRKIIIHTVGGGKKGKEFPILWFFLFLSLSLSLYNFLFLSFYFVESFTWIVGLTPPGCKEMLLGMINCGCP